MLISTKGRYALQVMIALASHDGGEFVPLKSIAEEQNISASGKYLEAVITVLSKEGIIDGHRGKGGGYKLTKSPDQYTVGSILRLTEGSLAPVSCLESPDALSCERMDCCRTLPMWRGLDHLINNYLDNITLADLIQPEEPWSNYVI